MTSWKLIPVLGLSHLESDHYGFGEEAKNKRLLKTRVKPMLFAVEFAFRLMLLICNVPDVPAVEPGLEAWNTKSGG